MSGFGPSASPGDFTVAASASVSNVIDGGGRVARWFDLPGCGVDGDGIHDQGGVEHDDFDVGV